MKAELTSLTTEIKISITRWETSAIHNKNYAAFCAGKFAGGQNSARQNFLTATLPRGEVFGGEINGGEINSGEISCGKITRRESCGGEIA